MGESVYLHGSEDVKNAACEMTRAATEITCAAQTIWEAVDRLAQVLADDRDARAEVGWAGAPRDRVSDVVIYESEVGIERKILDDLALNKRAREAGV
jgi:hypothetical protein